MVHFGRVGLNLSLAAVLLCLSATAGLADGRLLGAEQAWRLSQEGKVSVIDVRSAAEWRRTGIPRGARAVTIYDPRGETGFVDAMTRALGGDRTRPIAVICARGNRSTRAREMLERAGFTNVYDVVDGMLGRGAAKGWIDSGLPVERCRTC